MLRRIFGPRRDEVTGESRKLHNEDFDRGHPVVLIIKLQVYIYIY